MTSNGINKLFSIRVKGRHESPQNSRTILKHIVFIELSQQ